MKRRFKSWNISYNFNWNQPYLNRGSYLNCRSNYLNSATEITKCPFPFIEFALIFLFYLMLLSDFDYHIFKFIRLIEVSVLTLQIAWNNLSKFTINMYIYLYIYLAVRLSVCLFVCNKRQNIWTDRAQRNWVFATNANFIIAKSQQPDNAYLSYFKLTLLR